MRKERLKTMKHVRSMTAAAAIHSLIICWFLSLWSRSWSSLRSLVSIMSLIDANRRSTGLMLCPAAAADDDAIDVWSFVSSKSRIVWHVWRYTVSFFLLNTFHLDDVIVFHRQQAIFVAFLFSATFVTFDWTNEMTNDVIARDLTSRHGIHSQEIRKMATDVVAYLHTIISLKYYQIFFYKKKKPCLRCRRSVYPTHCSDAVRVKAASLQCTRITLCMQEMELPSLQQ